MESELADNPVANDTEFNEDQQPTGAKSIALPAVARLASVLSGNPVAARLWQLVAVWWGFTFLLGRVLGAHAHSTELAWLYDLAMFGTIWGFSFSAVRFRSGVEALEKLSGGSGSATMSDASRKTLRGWKVAMAVIAVMFFLVGVVNLLTGLFKVGGKSKVTGRIITPLYAYTTMVWTFPACGIVGGVIWSSYILLLQYASLLASETVEQVTQTLARYSPAVAEWKAEVIPAIKGLIDDTLPLVSGAFGDGLGYTTLGCWAGALGQLAGYLDGGTHVNLVLLGFFAFLPFGLAATLSQASDRCDELRDAINTKRGDDLGKDTDAAAMQLSELELRRLEMYLDNLNRGQGLGFLVFGIVIDKGMLNTIFTALVSVLFTLVPIILSLHDGQEGHGISGSAAGDCCQC